MSEFIDKFAGSRTRYDSGEHMRTLQTLRYRLIERPIILYGVGFYGSIIVKYLKMQNINVECFCDSKKRGIDAETGLKILSPQELCEYYNNANIIVSVANPHNEQSVYDTVKSLGFPDSQIFRFNDAYRFIRKSRVEPVTLAMKEVEGLCEGFHWAYEFFEDENSKKIIFEIINGYLFNDTFDYESPENSYFPQEFILSENEVFVDGGLYIGDTTEAFIKRVNGKYQRIVGFDIDDANLDLARSNLAKYKNVEVIAKGLWSESKKLHAELGIMAGSNINEEATEIVELTSLDEVFKNSSLLPTFIKLDVEGSEKQALLGAEDIIKTKTPKLAVCVYHKPEDVFELTRLLYQMNPSYRFFLRHYSPYVWETVLYAY